MRVPSQGIIARLSQGLGPTPGHLLLTRIRREVCAAILLSEGERARALASSDLEQFARCAEAALAEMRVRVDARAGRSGLLTSATARLDKAWRNSLALERLDDPRLPASRRARAACALGEVNRLLGSYDPILASLRPLVKSGSHVLEICAGHGGLAVAVASQFRKQGMDLRVTATDLRPEYLPGVERSVDEHACPVTFAALDALQLGSADLPAIDVVLCAQSLHHFEAGMVAMLFARAVAAAGTGVIFMDGSRNALLAPALALLGAYTRNLDVALDGLVSFRRFFAVEELWLLCGLSQPWGAVEAAWVAPTHAMVRCVRPDVT